jgi:hypothetical protein
MNDAHRQSRAIELLILNAFEIFQVDKEADRRQFFARNTEMTPPPEGGKEGTEMGEMAQIAGKIVP